MSKGTPKLNAQGYFIFNLARDYGFFLIVWIDAILLLAPTALCELQADATVTPAADCPWDGCYKDARSFRYEYKYSSKHVPLMKEQIWEIAFSGGQMKIYGDVSEYEFDQIQRYIPQNITSVLEVGCGLGRGSIFLNHLLKDDTIRYTLADRTGHTRNTGRFNPAEDEFYNDLALTQDFCELNGLKNITTFDTELGDWTALPKSDFIFSLCSFGMHVSIERYMERLLSAASGNCTMIFGVRDSSYGPDSFKDLFAEVIYLPEEVDKNGRPLSASLGLPAENWLILKKRIA